MEFRTRITIPSSRFIKSADDSFFLAGSCFASNVGARLEEYGFPVMTNPYGTLYNPSSLSALFCDIAEGYRFTEEDFFEYQGVFHSFKLHSSLSAREIGEALERANAAICAATEFLVSASVVCITLGTSFYYVTSAHGTPVSNCHKLPPATFERKSFTVSESHALLQKIIADIRRINPRCTVILTVSPVRHIADGLHANQLSKARLLLAVDSLLSEDSSGNLVYFPAYEIMMDDLRDYRFYDAKMTHPSPVAVDYIFERFCDSYMEPKVMADARVRRKEILRSSHRPLII